LKLEFQNALLQKLIAVLRETKAFLALEDNDFSWSSWRDQNQAISEIDSIIRELENGLVPDMRVLFVPTGPIQEVSLSSGWGNEFVKLAKRFDKEYEIVKNQS
jgi:hypothetical protein